MCAGLLDRLQHVGGGAGYLHVVVGGQWVFLYLGVVLEPGSKLPLLFVFFVLRVWRARPGAPPCVELAWVGSVKNPGVSFWSWGCACDSIAMGGVVCS